MRLQLHALAYNLANFMRTLALPKEVEHWSLTTLREKLVKIGAKVVRHGRYVTFQLAEVAVLRSLLILAPLLARSCHVRSVLFAGEHGFFEADPVTVKEPPHRAMPRTDTPLPQRRSNLLDRQI